MTNPDSQAKKGFNIAIVGAGVAGLVTAIALRSHGHAIHNVTVFERYAELKPIGGPVGIGPNGSRLLIGLGLGDKISSRVPKLRTMLNAYRYSDGKQLRAVPAGAMKEAFGAPHWNISRHHLLQILLEHAKSLGVTVRFGVQIDSVDVDSEHPIVLQLDDATYRYDLVVGADGIQSNVRTSILGRKIDPRSPLTAYNINIPRRLLAADPDLEFLLEHSGGWFGPRRFIMAMDMPDFNDQCNFCFCSEQGDGKEGEWFVKGDIRTVQAQFADFEPRVQKLLEIADPEACYLWRLSDIPSLETWHSNNGRAVIIGDAAHAMLPYAGMGVGSGIEDAVCLAECLNRVESSSKETDLKIAMDAFEAIRKPRTIYTAKVGRNDMRAAHLPDGPEQEKRDAMLASPSIPKSDSGQGNVDAGDFDPLTDDASSITPEGRAYLGSYDVLKHTRKYLATQGWAN